MLKVICGVFCLAALTLAALGCVASVQDTVRIRGTIEKVDGAVYVVKSRDGSELKVSLADNPLMAAIVKASLSDIKQGSLIGATGMPQPDGSRKAIEVHILPKSMRGTGEGHYAWDLQPQSTMTNANVEQAVAGVDGQTLTMKHKNGENKVVVTPQTAIVTYVPGDKNEIKPGTKIFIAAAKKQPDGSLQTPRINYGKDGLTPPM
jgi:outer membrane lipoprotein SlyB